MRVKSFRRPSSTFSGAYPIARLQSLVAFFAPTTTTYLRARHSVWRSFPDEGRGGGAATTWINRGGRRRPK